MRPPPLISAIIIFLNEKDFLQEAIESVIAQTYTNWELLLVDDGSTDGSCAMARKAAEAFPEKIRYLEHAGHQNRGMSASRSLGIRHAAGKYVAFLDGDDAWLPAKLERQLEILEANPEATMVYGPLRLWYSWTGNPEDSRRDGLYGIQPNGRHPFSNQIVGPPKLLCLFLRFEQYIPSGFLIRKDVIGQPNLYEEVFREAYSDAVALVKICLRWPVFISEESWYLYRKHKASSTYRSWQKGLEHTEKLAYLEWVKGYLAGQNVSDARIWLALQRALLPYHHPKLYDLFMGTLAAFDRLKGPRARSLE
jgi:glycosyltransferase involved in cell wall biosynthesis